MLTNIEISLLHFLQVFRNEYVDCFVIFWDKITDNGFLYLLIAFIFLFIKRFRITGILSIISILSTAVFVKVIKVFVARQRPFVIDDSFTPINNSNPLESFPSGHASISFAFMGILIYFFPKYKYYFVGYGVLMAFSRLYGYVHFLTDVVTGALIGLLVSTLIIKIYKKIFNI